MEKGNLKSAFQKLRAERVDDVIEGLNDIEWKIKGLRGKDLNEAILALCGLFYMTSLTGLIWSLPWTGPMSSVRRPRRR